jgi:tRNA(adenine34) deaminase
MCAGAILESKISKLVFGAFRQKTNSHTAKEIIRSENKKIEIVSGVLETECSEILTNWFTNHRRKTE